MKKIINSTVILILILFTSCDNWLDVNNNLDTPDVVNGEVYLPGIQQAYQGIYYDIRAIGPMIQTMGYVSTSSYGQFGNHYYLEGSDAGGETWRFVYWVQGMNLENLINQAIEKKEYRMAGIGLAMKAFSWDMMTKINGELPMKQAFQSGVTSFNYDYQKEIYPQIRTWAYDAIKYLTMEDNTQYGTRISANDYIYSGDYSKWIKFAYAVIVRNLASLSNKNDFNTAYANELIEAAKKSFTNSEDDAAVRVAGGSISAPFSDYNNFWGVTRKNLYTSSSVAYFQHEYAVQVMTGSVPKYDETNGDKIKNGTNPYFVYVPAEKQIICDTLYKVQGHYDPRMAVKLATSSNPNYINIGVPDEIKKYRYYGGTGYGRTGSIGAATTPTFYGRDNEPTPTLDGKGKWLYHDEAPYILTTCAEIKFCLAEAYFKLGNKAESFATFKDGIKADMDFTAKYIKEGVQGSAQGGDKITKAAFVTMATEYLAGPYVQTLNMDEFSLSHIMMQKWVALYPWGACEAWTDMRKYQYDINFTGEYPKLNNGWDINRVQQKWDTDPLKVYKGFWLPTANVANRRGFFDTRNNGSPAYRLRPRYNSEYMWNLQSLKALKPIPGTANNYHTSIPWFAYKGEQPDMIQ